jgi:hypothetical protein
MLKHGDCPYVNGAVQLRILLARHSGSLGFEVHHFVGHQAALVAPQSRIRPYVEPTTTTMTTRIPEAPGSGVLYHYTSLEGVFGIARSKTIWATDSAFLTDSSEYIHGLSRLRESVEKRLESAAGRDRNLLLHFLDFIKTGVIQGSNVYVASFTENGNQLSQWRGYTPDDAGVSIGFSAEKVLAFAESQNFLLARCAYTPGEHAAVLNAIVELALSAPTTDVNDDGERSHWEFFQDKNDDFLGYLLRMKHESFREEDECRLISRGFLGNDKVRYRVGAAAVIPFVEFNLPTLSFEDGWQDEGFVATYGYPKNYARLDVEQVFLGPSSLQGSRTRSSLNNGLLANGVWMGHKVKDSGIPYRPRVR